MKINKICTRNMTGKKIKQERKNKAWFRKVVMRRYKEREKKKQKIREKDEEAYFVVFGHSILIR